MIAFAAESWLALPGRGTVAVVDLGARDAPGPDIGETVLIDGLPYRVHGVERARVSMSPSFLDRRAGLVVRRVETGDPEPVPRLAVRWNAPLDAGPGADTAGAPRGGGGG